MEAKDNILFFESDKEFEDFCIRPYADLISRGRRTIKTSCDYTDEYKQCLKEGKRFIIKAETTKFLGNHFATRCVPVRPEGDKPEITQAVLPVENVEFYDSAIAKKLKIEMLKDVFFEKRSISIFDAADKDWLMKKAEKGNIYAIYCLLNGMHRKYASWYEMFVDEDTDDKVFIWRNDLIDGVTFITEDGEEERLKQMLYDARGRMTKKELKYVRFLPIDTTPLMLELIKRGYDGAASFINDKVILQYLCDNGNKYAAYELYFKNMCGDEEYGFFISKRRARSYFELAKKLGYKFRKDELNELDEEDQPGAEYPQSFKYTLSGDVAKINTIRMLIDDLCERFGTPDNELGLYVPQRILMKVLVGSDTEYYRGIVITMEQATSNRLVIKTEADQGYPLFYALRYAFRGLNVEMERLDNIV